MKNVRLEKQSPVEHERYMGHGNEYCCIDAVQREETEEESIGKGYAKCACNNACI